MHTEIHIEHEGAGLTEKHVRRPSVSCLHCFEANASGRETIMDNIFFTVGHPDLGRISRVLPLGPFIPNSKLGVCYLTISNRLALFPKLKCQHVASKFGPF